MGTDAMTLRPWQPSGPLKLRPWDGRPDRRTPKQQAAHLRTWRIFRLRGLYYLCMILSEERRRHVLSIIDAELQSLGAETETARIAMRADDAGRQRLADDD